MNISVVNHIRWRLLPVLLLLLMGSAQAQCDISTSGLTFSHYDFLNGAPTDSSTQLRVQCEAGVSYRIMMSAGINSSGNFLSRQMMSTDSGSILKYNIYLDPSYSLVWGNGQASSSFFQSISGVSPTLVPIYGRIPPKQSVPIGQYFDAIVVTVEW